MVEKKGGFKSNLRTIVVKALKATMKGGLFYALYYVLWMFLGPFAGFVPSLEQSIETFVAVYIILIVIGEFTAGSVYQYFFGAARALFAISYLILSLNGGMMGVTFENMSLLVDLRLFLVVAMLLSLLGLAKSVLQAINFMNVKAELPHV